jgi:hypothetical protein
MKKLVFLSICIFSFSLHAQEIKGRLLDKNNNEPIPFANVTLSNNYGVITNDEGYFVLQQKDYSASTPIVFSSMGYEQRQIAISDFIQNQTVYLDQANNMLQEIVLRNTNLSLEEIMSNMTNNLSKNHDVVNQRVQYFMRNKTTSMLKKANFELDKAAGLSKKEVKEINEAIKNKDLVKAEPYSGFSEKLFNAYYLSDSTKISFIKHLKLSNPEKDNSSEGAQAKIMKRVFQNLESDNTFNIKTGIIPIAKKVKLSNYINNNNDTIKNVITSEYKNLLGKNRIINKEFIANQNKYIFTKKEVTYVNGILCYHIGFVPNKNKGDFTGNLYINVEDFGIIRYDYKLIEGKLLNSLNLKFLMGIKMNVNAREEFAIFSKSNQNSYLPRYIKTTIGSYVYFDRSLNFTENNPDKDKRKQLKIDLLQESNQTSVNELLAVEIDALEALPNIPKYIIGDSQSKFDAGYWKNYNIIEATKEIKNYE